jgi:hypothetical protein
MTPTAQDAQNLLNQIQNAYNRLNETNPFANFQITNVVTDVAQLEAALRGVTQRIADARTGIDEVTDAFKRSVDEIKNQQTAVSRSTKALNGLQSIAQKLSYDQAGITKLSLKQLENLQEQAKQRKKDLQLSRDALQQEILIMQSQQNLSQADQELLNKKIDALGKINVELTDQNSNYQALQDTLNVRIQQEKEINKLLGLGGAAIEGMSGALNKLGLGSLSNKLGIEDAQEEMRKIAEEIQNSGASTDDFAGKMKVLKGGASSMGKSLLTNLTDPLAQATFFIDQLFKALKGSDAAAADMAKGMNMSYKEALATRRELTAMASATGNNFVNTRGMQESYMAINKSLGTSVMLNEDMLVQFTEMREMAGFTNEELQGIAAISIATGKEINDVTGEFMAQAKMSALQNGVLLNEKDLVKEIKDVSAATTLSLGKNPKLIGEAVATAKSLGMELSKVDGIAESLLDFESSISSELEAELLLGKDINLEKARQAALNNDLATVAKEISDQAGSSAEFAKMNRIQQEALAKSIGMNREDLAKTLFVQEQLTGLTGDAAKEQEDLLNKRIEEVGLAQAQKELAEGGIEGLREQAGLADKFNATMEKVQELFVMIADPILVILDAFSPILEIVGALVGLIGKLGEGASYFGEKLTEWTSGLGIIGSLLRGLGYAMVLMAGYGAYAALSPIPVVGPVLGAAAAAAIITGGFSAINSAPKKVGDVMSPADGKTTISTREGGLYELSKNDDLVAAPGAVDRMKNGGGTTVVNQAPPVDNTESKRTNMLLEKIAGQSPVFKIGTDEFFTSTSKYSYQVQ